MRIEAADVVTRETDRAKAETIKLGGVVADDVVCARQLHFCFEIGFVWIRLAKALLDSILKFIVCHCRFSEE